MGTSYSVTMCGTTRSFSLSVAGFLNINCYCTTFLFLTTTTAGALLVMAFAVGATTAAEACIFSRLACTVSKTQPPAVTSGLDSTCRRTNGFGGGTRCMTSSLGSWCVAGDTNN